MADLILYTGPMFSSKTTKLLMQADKRHYQKQKVIAFKSKIFAFLFNFFSKKE